MSMHVLVVDDNQGVRDALQLLFTLHDLEVRVAATPAQALRIVDRGQTGVVVQDMNFSASATTGEEGETLFRQLRVRDPNLPIILVTAWTSLEMAVSLVREGADDYIGKPWDDQVLVEKVRRLMAARALQSDKATLAEADLAGLVYASPELHALVSLALRIAPADVLVLITGASGTGKERLAELIRANSSRVDAPFITLNAGALPTELLEAELFGAEAGAYTGSKGLRKGRFEVADGGTLFLDEIGALSADGQAALLRVLQTGEYQRLGSSQTRHADVRIIAATNADLKAEVAEGRFREDLYYRLAVIELAIPPLAERPDDIDPIVDHFLAQAGLGPEALDGSTRRTLREHPWPGNVRELENCIRRAALVRTGERIGPADLGLVVLPGLVRPGGDPTERREVEIALQAAEGVVSRAAEALGLSRQALYRRMRRLGITVERNIR